MDVFLEVGKEFAGEPGIAANGLPAGDISLSSTGAVTCRSAAQSESECARIEARFRPRLQFQVSHKLLE